MTRKERSEREVENLYTSKARSSDVGASGFDEGNARNHRTGVGRCRSSVAGGEDVFMRLLAMVTAVIRGNFLVITCTVCTVGNRYFGLMTLSGRVASVAVRVGVICAAIIMSMAESHISETLRDAVVWPASLFLDVHSR